MPIRVELDVDEVVEGLRRVQSRLGRNVGQALEMGANLVVNRAKTHHDYTDRTGAATNSIVAEPVSGSFAGGDLTVTVAGGAPHFVFLEFGTKRHKDKIRPRHRKALRWPVEGGFAFATEVDHPGTPAYEPLAKALESEFGQIVELVGDATEAAFAEEGL